MTNDDDCPNDDDDDDDPAGGGQRLEDDWMGYLLIKDADYKIPMINDADCTNNSND